MKLDDGTLVCHFRPCTRCGRDTLCGVEVQEPTCTTCERRAPLPQERTGWRGLLARCFAPRR